MCNSLKNCYFGFNLQTAVVEAGFLAFLWRYNYVIHYHYTFRIVSLIHTIEAGM